MPMEVFGSSDGTLKGVRVQTGAGGGDRTRLLGLGSSHSAIELHPQRAHRVKSGEAYPKSSGICMPLSFRNDF